MSRDGLADVILEKLAGTGKVILLDMNDCKLEWTARHSQQLKAGSRITVLLPKDVTMTAGDTMTLTMPQVILEEP